MTARRPGPRDFDEDEAYLASRELARFVAGLEDRFPDDEKDLIYLKLREASVELGATIAAAVSGQRKGSARRLPSAALREALARLGQARHYVLIAQAEHLIDAERSARFQAIHDRLRDLLDGGPSARPPARRAGR